jgi:hypothetical protein
MDPCEHGNVPSGSVKGVAFLDYLSDYQLLKLRRTMLHGVSLMAFSFCIRIIQFTRKLLLGRTDTCSVHRPPKLFFCLFYFLSDVFLKTETITKFKALF